MTVPVDDILPALADALEGRYRIRRELGRGGMALVYLADDLRHQRPVAVKILRPELASAIGAERFLREIRIAANLGQHPHILPLHDSGNANGFLYYVMPFVEGESLRDRLKREKRLPWREAIEIAREVASALDFAHSRDIVHRDIKPGNILLAHGHAVVSDFGIARAVHGGGHGEPLTQVDFAIGTPEYMSPEQAMSDPGLDGRADLYALGCVLYEMIAGRVPFEGERTSTRLDSNHRVRRRLIRSGVGRAVPRHIRRAIEKALAPDPADRFRTGAEFGRALTVSMAGARSPRRTVALFGVTAVMVLALLTVLTATLGLPYWILAVTTVLLAVEGPAVFLTARAEHEAAQARATGTPVRAAGLVRWRTVRMVSTVAIGAVGLIGAGRMFAWGAGLGPSGALMGAGVMDRQDRIILADFTPRGVDSTWASAVTEALRIDVSQSPVVSVVDRERIARTLTRMGRPADASLSPPVAREIAIRDGFKAVLNGEVSQVGGSYVLTAELVHASDGATLAAFRETARDSSRIIAAIDRLSDRVRSRIGESLRTIRSTEALGAVTTRSLPALRAYSEAVRALRRGDILAGRRLLTEAVRLDSAFAMAYRKLGTVAFDRASQVSALTRAYRFRDRLTARERGLTEGAYHRIVTGRIDEAAAAYRGVVDRYPDDVTGINNLAEIELYRRRFGRARRLFDRLTQINPSMSNGLNGLIVAAVAQGDWVAAHGYLERFREAFPDNPVGQGLGILLHLAEHDYRAAAAALDSLRRVRGDDRFWLLNVESLATGLDLTRGRLRSAESHARAAVRVADALEIPASALSVELQLAFFDTWFRDDPTAALARMERALEMYPLDTIDPANRPYLLMVQVYAGAGRPDRAEAVLRAFEGSLNPAERALYAPARDAVEGVVLLARRESAKAVERFRAADVGRCTVCILPLLAQAYDQMGNADSAIAVYERYATTPSILRGQLTDIVSLASAYERLGQLYRDRADTTRAVDYFGRFVELWSEADPVLQPRVAAARSALVALTTDAPRPE